MFKNTFQSGFLSILYSIGSKPLQIWDKKGARPLALPAGRLARGVLLRSKNSEEEGEQARTRWLAFHVFFFQ